MPIRPRLVKFGVDRTYFARYGVRAWMWWFHKGAMVLKVSERFVTGAHSQAFSKLYGRVWNMPSLPALAIGSPEGGKPHADSGEWGVSYPTLFGYLTDPSWPDGRKRQPGKLFVNVQRGRWVLTLKDTDLGYLCSVEVDLPEDLLPAMEAILRGPNPPWQPDPWHKPRAQGRAKKAT